MTDRATLIEKTKVQIRALLLSVQSGLTVEALKKDFHDYMGEPLPYRKMGYNSVEDCVREMSDVAMLDYSRGSLTLKAIADETTMHIQKLVSRQKVSTKKRYAVSRQGPPQRHYQREPSRYPNRQYSSHQEHFMPKVPVYMKQQLKQLFNSYPDGVPLTHFDAAFSKRFGCHLNFRKFNFNTLTDLLASLTDVVKLQTFQAGETRVVPVGSHSTRYYPPKKDGPGYTETPSVKGAATPLLNQTVIPSKVSVTMTNADSNNNNTREHRPSKGRGRRKMKSGDVQENKERDTKQEEKVSMEEAGQFEDDDSGVSETLQLELRQLLDDKPDGVWASQLTSQYKKQYNKGFDCYDQGYRSVIDFMAALPHIAHIERPDPQGDWLLFDARIPKSEINIPEIKEKPHQARQAMDQETYKDQVRKLLQRNSNGILVKDFPDMFEKFTGHKLPMEELGFSNPEALALSLVDSILQITYQGQGNLVLFPIGHDIPNLRAGNSEVTEELSSPNPHNRPSDTVGPGCHYTPMVIPEANAFVEVYVSNVVNPSLFWIQLRKRSASLALEKLMDQLEYTYRGQGSVMYKMADSMLAPGQVCVTLFPEDNNWHRGVIMGSNDEGFIEVYFIDYGNTNFVDKSTICYLKLEYLKLPVQAIQARLANIKSVGKSWKVSAKNRLLQLCISKPLVAFVTTTRDQVMTVCLTDTNTSVDIHINDVLVTEGYAIFSMDDDQTSYAGPENRPEVPNYSYVYGWCSYGVVPRVPKAALNSPNQEGTNNTEAGLESTDPLHQQSYVKWVQLTATHDLHLINLDGVAYTISAEISSFFWDDDILTGMLNQQSAEVPKLLVTSSNYPDLFEELQRYEVKSLKEDFQGMDLLLALYELSSIPYILQLFDHPCTELRTAVQQLNDSFESQSSYWKKSNVTAETSAPVETDTCMSLRTEEVPDAELSHDMKRVTLQVLQFRRKRILQMLMTDPSVPKELVNELNDHETEIMLIKQELEGGANMKTKSTGILTELHPTLTADAAADLSHQRPNKLSPNPDGAYHLEDMTNTAIPDLTCHSQAVDNQKIIDGIIAATTKPIASVTANPSSTFTLYNQSATTTTTVTSASGGYQGYQTASTPYGAPEQPSAVNFASLIQQQHQRFPSPQIFAQTAASIGFPLAGQTGFSASGQAGQTGMTSLNTMYTGLLPAVMPLMYNSNVQQMTGLPQVNQLLQGMGRGQPNFQSPLELLPGLYPLLQNLSVGRGGGAMLDRGENPQ